MSTEMVETKPPKPFKGKRETYDVDGVIVELVQVPPDMRVRTSFFDRTKVEAEKVVRSQWEVYVDGVLRGYAVYPLGVANPWEAYTLIPDSAMQYITRPEAFDLCQPLCDMQPDSESIPGCFDDSDGRFNAAKPMHSRFNARAEIAHVFPNLVRAGNAPSVEETRALIQKEKRKMIARKAQDARDAAANDIRRAREKAEREAAAAQAEADRSDTLAALSALRANAAATSHMTNRQIAALEDAILAFTK